jgi:subtilisin
MAISKVLIRAPASPERLAAARMTGRYLVTMQPDAQKDISAKLNRMGMKAVAPLPRAAVSAKPMPDGSHQALAQIGIALVDPKSNQEDSLHQMAAQENGVLAIEPERIVRAVTVQEDYLRGWRDAVDALSAKLLDQSRAPAAVTEAAVEDALTWGLTATKADRSSLSGANIKIAILDTGFDTSHPDFAQRTIVTKNFVGDGVPFHDGVGHGTHCIGTAAGPRQPATGPRYGIAYGAAIYAGRVLDDTGRGGDFNILEGINWAVEQRCEVISLSLGAPWSPGDPTFSPAYEAAAKRALDAGSLLVVAAGNDGENPQFVGAVGTPGNSPSVLTVAAVDRNLATAPFSNGLRVAAPGVKGPELAGPGVDVYSSWPVSHGSYNTISGTSMATPHVAGIAALFAQSDRSARGQKLKDMIINQCLALANGTARRGEIGRGLVQAPDASISSSQQRGRRKG